MARLIRPTWAIRCVQSGCKTLFEVAKLEAEQAKIDANRQKEVAIIEAMKLKETAKLNKEAALEWIKKGAQPTETVQYLINNCNEDGTLNYQKKEVEKISKKAQAKLEAAKKAEEEAKAAAATEEGAAE